jgi:hypothetical protein
MKLSLLILTFTLAAAAPSDTRGLKRQYALKELPLSFDLAASAFEFSDSEESQEDEINTLAKAHFESVILRKRAINDVSKRRCTKRRRLIRS